MRLTSVVTEIITTHRLVNTASGNPRWKVHTKNGSFITESDAQVAFGITSVEYTDGKVKLTLNNQNKIIGISKIKESK